MSQFSRNIKISVINYKKFDICIRWRGFIDYLYKKVKFCCLIDFIFLKNTPFWTYVAEQNIYVPRGFNGDDKNIVNCKSLMNICDRNDKIQSSIKKSVFFGIWCLKRRGLSKDMASLIGKYVWKSRGRVEFWLQDKFYLF